MNLLKVFRFDLVDKINKMYYFYFNVAEYMT